RRVRTPNLEIEVNDREVDQAETFDGEVDRPVAVLVDQDGGEVVVGAGLIMLLKADLRAAAGKWPRADEVESTGQRGDVQVVLTVLEVLDHVGEAEFLA